MTFWDFANNHLFYIIAIIVFIFILLFILIWLTIYLFNKYGMILSVRGIELKKREEEQEELNNKSKIHEYAIRDVLVYGELSQLCAYFSADICGVFQLHNGGHYNNGISVQKFTLSHDFTATGKSALYMKSVKFKDQLISQAKDWVGETIIKGTCFLKINEMEESSTWRREFVRNGICNAILKLVETNEVPELIVGVFFRREITEEELQFSNYIMNEYTDKVSSILKDGEVIL